MYDKRQEKTKNRKETKGTIKEKKEKKGIGKENKKKKEKG